MFLFFFFLFFPFSVKYELLVALSQTFNTNNNVTNTAPIALKLRLCLFRVKNLYKKYFTPNKVFGWIRKYGQTEINFSLTIKFWPLQCKIIYTSILPSIELHSYFSAFTRERERESVRRIFGRIYIFSSNNFMWKPNTRNYFPSYFPEHN